MAAKNDKVDCFRIVHDYVPAAAAGRDLFRCQQLVVWMLTQIEVCATIGTLSVDGSKLDRDLLPCYY